MITVLHLRDIMESVPEDLGDLHVIWFEEVSNLSVRLSEPVRAADPVLWNGNSPWPTWHNRPTAFYLWISATAQVVDTSVSPDLLFVCMNRQPKDHRWQMVRGLFKAGLHHVGAVSYDGLLPENLRDQIPRQIDFVPPQNCLPVTQLPMVWLNRAAISIVTETRVCNFDISEKTYQCLAVGQPFLSLGCVGLHHTLFEWGFEPLPGVDYAFDLEPNPDLRRKSIIAQLKTWSHHRPSTLKRHWRATCEHNRSHFQQQVRNLKLPFDVESAQLGYHAGQTIEELFKLQQLYQ